MLNFTVGPVMSSDEVLEIASHSTPYFRTQEFSELMLSNERMTLGLFNAPKGSRCVFLTASGTGAMESCVMNILSSDDKAIVINGGSFGKRFVELCELHKRSFTEVKCEFGSQLRAEQLIGLEDHTALLINMHETSSGVLYDMEMVSNFCRKNGILLIVDAISSFIADDIDMTRFGAAAIITGSQKALAVQPGVSLVVMAPAALERVEANEETCMYLSLKKALADGVRGQTPFTPAVTTLLQINERLSGITDLGIGEESRRIARVAKDFRDGIAHLPLENVAESPSNAVTCLRPIHGNAGDVVRVLKDEYGIWVCPNGGEMANTVFRVGHIGHISDEDNRTLLDALNEMNDRGLL